MVRLLLRRDFGLAWLGGLVSMIGNWALWIALPIHIYRETGSALAVSGIVAAAIAPSVLLGSVAGVYVDRWNRKTTLVVANLLLAAAALPLLAAEHRSLLWVAYPLVFVSGALAEFVGPAENAFLPRLVPERDLLTANALNALNNNFARLVGPVVGGAAVALGGLAGVVVLDAATFLAAAGLIALVRAPGAVEPSGSEGEDTLARGWRRMWREWRGGLEVVRRVRAVRVVFAFAAVAAVGEGVFAVMFVVWVRELLDGGALELGWLHTAQAVGGLLGGAATAWLARRVAAERLFGVAAIVFGALDLALFNYPLLLSGVWIGVGLMVLVGIPAAWLQAARATLLQTHVEDAYRGRVFGALSTTAALLMLAGTGLAGGVGGALGPIALLNVQGGAYVAGGLLALIALSGARAARRGGAAPAGAATRPQPAGAGPPRGRHRAAP